MTSPSPNPLPAAEWLRAMLVTELAQILRVDEAEIDPRRDFDEYGLDSTDAVIVVGLIEDRLKIEITPELLLQNRCIDDAVKAIETQLKAAGARPASSLPSGDR